MCSSLGCAAVYLHVPRYTTLEWRGSLQETLVIRVWLLKVLVAVSPCLHRKGMVVGNVGRKIAAMSKSLERSIKSRIAAHSE